MLSEKEIARYSRHLLLPEIGTVGQEKLKNSKVLVIGAGGLGCPVLMYLAAAGVGKLGIVDFDTIDESNLQRQVLYNVNDIGRSKAETAKQKLSLQNPLIRIENFNSKLTVQNALHIFSEYDIIVDGTDNFSTRYLVNDACVLLGKILVSGSIFKFQGQISVFNLKDARGNFGPTYRCLFPSPPPAGSTQSCSEIGVMGVLPGIIGTLMANETIKIITGIGEVLAGKMLLIDSLTINFHTVEIEKNPEAIKATPQDREAFGRMDYEHFCGIAKSVLSFKEVTPEELFSMISSKENIQLLDVREKNEIPDFPLLNDLKIPLGEIEDQVTRISRDKKVIVICRSGNRSRKAIELLSGKFGFENLYNLKGGVMNWIGTVTEKQKV
jgi:adenylyltransferase/sulfurtransferase